MHTYAQNQPEQPVSAIANQLHCQQAVISLLTQQLATGSMLNTNCDSCVTILQICHCFLQATDGVHARFQSQPGLCRAGGKPVRFVRRLQQVCLALSEVQHQ